MSGSRTELETVTIAKDAGLATITLARPEALNAFNVQMRDDLSQVFSWLQVDPDVRACVFMGKGRAFCAGADLTEFGTAPSPAVARRVRWERDVWKQLLLLPQPTVAAIHGYAIGSGLELALCCDIRYAARGAVLAFPETKLGFIPAAGGTQLLPRTVPHGWASQMLLTGARLTADEAGRANLVNRVLPDDDRAQAFALEVAGRLVELPPASVRQAKRALRVARELPLAQGVVAAEMLRRQLEHSRSAE